MTSWSMLCARKPSMSSAAHCLYLPVVAEYRQFHKFIILIMMLLF